MRLPKENLYVTRGAICRKLIMLSGDELLQMTETRPEKNHGYRFKCPGCEGKTDYTTTELLMQYGKDFENDVLEVPFDIGHPFVIDEPYERRIQA